MRRLYPAVTLSTALLTAASAAFAIPGRALGQVPGALPAPARTAPTAPMAPEPPRAIGAIDPMAAARAPRHLLRNGQDYLTYGEYQRALALFREAESRIGELNPQEQEQLRQAIEAARLGMRSPEPPSSSSARGELASRSLPARSTAALPGAIALAEPTAAPDDRMPAPSPVGSPDGVVLTSAEAIPPIPREAPVPPEPIAVDPSVMPSAVPAEPQEIDLPPPPPPSEAEPTPIPPLDSEAPALPEPAQPEAASSPAPSPTGPEITLPPLPSSDRGDDPWPTASIGSRAANLPQGGSSPLPPDELPALPPSAEELMGLGHLGSRPPQQSPDAARSPSPIPSPTPEPAPFSSARAAMATVGDQPSYRDLLSPEQREEVMMIVRRQEEAEQQGLMPAPLGDPIGYGYDREDMSSSSIQLPRPPSPTEIRPIQSIPVPEDFVPLPDRRFQPSRKYWAAAATCHAPLYFQDPVLERYGQSVEQKLGPIGRFLSYPLDDPTQSRQRNQIAQPLFSAALFAAEIATWPYKVIVDPPGEAEYDLGYYRPGDLVPPDLFYVPTTGIGPPLQGKKY
ncbi:hypothetical protein [Tautonia sociabilis]|uniref:Tetratricopeptide repeat protein n=1 Tax=Tautonia sociabilis TaxID=2080755 RepID=A0A432MEC0_9BACT|nr:hypothetical protein [Tautonia sociabilis]RUL83664.1 hypothetical protein TsocGM_21770 [Tautonia sociabilis]